MCFHTYRDRHKHTHGLLFHCFTAGAKIISYLVGAAGALWLLYCSNHQQHIHTHTHTRERQGESQQQCRICIIPGNPYAALFQDNDDGIMFSDYHCFYFISIYFITTQHYTHWFNIHNGNFVRFTYYYCIIIIIWVKITTTTVKKLNWFFFQPQKRKQKLTFHYSYQ